MFRPYRVVFGCAAALALTACAADHKAPPATSAAAHTQTEGFWPHVHFPARTTPPAAAPAQTSAAAASAPAQPAPETAPAAPPGPSAAENKPSSATARLADRLAFWRRRATGPARPRSGTETPAGEPSTASQGEVSPPQKTSAADRLAFWRRGDHHPATQPTPVPATTGDAGPPAALAALDVWAQSQTALPPDPRMRFGTLPNGMRYVIMRNATPGGQASIRFRVRAGSIDESDDQQGLAHLLEHMAFNGSTHVARGEMVNILQRHGLAFGADTDASTSWEETVYKLDLPKADPDTIETSIGLLREIASELTLDPAAIEREKGVVLSEERLRDTPGYRTAKASIGLMLEGQRAPSRFPIGLVETVRAADHDRLKRFYDAYYRPERTVLVAVGDFDPDAMETLIRSRFGDWSGRGAPGPDPDLGRVETRASTVRTHAEPGAPDMVELAWARPADLTADSEAKRRRATIDGLGLAVLNRRLEALSRSDAPPFTSAVAYQVDQFHSARVAALQATARPGDWRSALKGAETVERQALAFGVSQDELDRAIDTYRTALKAEVDGAATRATPAVAEDIIATIAIPEVETAPEADLDLFERAIKGLKPADVDAAVRSMFSGQGPLVFVSGQSAEDQGEPAVLAALKADSAAPLQPPVRSAEVVWPYEDFGTPGKVVERTEVQDLDAVTVRFANGVRLVVKPTKFKDDQVLVNVRIAGGIRSLPSDRPTPAWAAQTAFIEGGLEQVTVQDLETLMRSRIVGMNLAIDEDAFELSGVTRPDDLETQMQVLAAYLAHPGFRSAAFERIRSAAPTLDAQLASTASGVLNRDLGVLLHGGDPRFGIPPQEAIRAQSEADLKALIQPALQSGAVEIDIVGDTTVDKAIDAVAATFGALPDRAAPETKAGTNPIFPAPTAQPVRRTHKGRADQAIAFAAWPTDDFLSNTQTARTLRLLADILQMRLIDQIRKDEGLTYSPSAGSFPSKAFAHYGYIAARVEIPPDRVDGFFRDLDAIVADLRAHPVSNDELLRAKTPAIDDLEKRRRTNEYWLAALGGVTEDPRRLAVIRSSEAQLSRVTAEEIQAAAQHYLDPAGQWRLVVAPESAGR